MPEAVASGPAKERQTLHGIQILRGIAASIVVAYHVFLFGHEGTLHSRFTVGAAGVDIFFAISGVVMFLTAPALKPGDFLMRRIVRIVPLYWLFMALKVALIAVSSHGSHRSGLDLAYIVKSFLFIPAIDGVGNILPLIGVGWTLEFEMYFYLVCTLALLVNPRWLLPICGAVIVTGVAIGLPFLWFGHVRPPAPVVLLSPISIEFIGGMVAAWLWSKGARLPLWGNLILIAIAIAWLSIAPDQTPYAGPRLWWWGAPALLILAAFLGMETQVPFGRLKLPLLIGDASYAIYLVHTAIIPILGGLLRKLGPVPEVLALPAMLAASLCAGILVHLVIEKPLVRALARLLHARPPKIGGAPA